MATPMQWRPLGRMAYTEALEVQQARVERLLDLADDWQTVYTVEHPPTITIGRNGSRENILASESELCEQGFQVFDVDRGGDVTYHGPGQLVVYPVFHLNPWKNDVGAYVRRLEQTVIDALAEVDIDGVRSEGLPGVWVGHDKVCAIGARMRRRHSGEFVTSHGFALNVCTNLQHFNTIIPCGLADRGVTSISQLQGKRADLEEWEERILRSLLRVFDGVLAKEGSDER